MAIQLNERVLPVLGECAINPLRQQIAKYLPKERFGRNVFILAAGTIAGQGATVLVMPILTRLYTPESFGVLAVITAILGILTIFASYRYELAIPLSESVEEAASVVLLCLALISVTTLVCCIVLFLFSDQIAGLLNSPEISNLLWLVPIGLVFIGVYNVCNYWAIRTNSFKEIAQTKLTQALMAAAVQIAGFKTGTLALIGGHMAGQSAGIGSLAFLAISKEVKTFNQVTASDLLQVAKKHKNFPLFSTWAGLLNSVGNFAPHLLYAGFFGAGAAGFYFIASKVLSVPLSLLGRAIGQAYYAEAPSADQAGNLYAFSIKTAKRLFLVIIGPVLIIMIFGEKIFSIALGAEWGKAGVIAQWLAPMALAQFIVAPIGNLLAIRGKQKLGAYLQALLTTMRLLSIYAGYYYNNFMLAVIAFSITSTIGYVLFLLFSLKNAK